MAFASLLRKSATSLAPLVSRFPRVHRNYHSTLFTALSYSPLSHKSSRGLFAPVFKYSTTVKRPSSDELLVRVIDLEIKCAEESDDHNQDEKAPSDFPFEIENNPGHQTITLIREYQGEHVKVEVHMPDLVTGENEEDATDDENENATQSSIPLVVTVTKKSGPSLEFSCTAFPDKISIDGLAVRHPENAPEEQIAYEGPDFNDLDENLQKAFHKYLELRGIKPSTTNFLHEYMINKDSREYLLWLKNLKKFVEA